MRKLQLFTLVALFCWGSAVQAEVKHGLGGSFEYLAVDSTTALEQGVGEDVGGFQGAYTATFNKTFFASLGLGVLFFDDDAEFKALVREERIFHEDRIVVEESDVTGVSVQAEVGARYPVTEKIVAVGAVGYRFIDAERDIEFCENCHEEDVDVDGGVYLSPSLMYLFSEKVQASLGGQFYLSGDLEATVFLSFNFILK